MNDMAWKRWRGDKLLRTTKDEMSAGLVRAAEATLGESLKQVPLDEGTLQETGMTKVNPRNKLEVVLSFGGGFGTPFTRVPYAIKWHEQPANFQHGRKHNYVRDPINNFAPGAVKKELQKAGRQAW